MTRVVVTGIGATSPIGGTARASWDALLAWTSGVRSLDHEWVEKYEIPVTFRRRSGGASRGCVGAAGNQTARPQCPACSHLRTRSMG